MCKVLHAPQLFYFILHKNYALIVLDEGHWINPFDAEYKYFLIGKKKM